MIRIKNVRSSKSILILVLAFCFSSRMLSQRLLDSLTLDTLAGYTSIAEALKEPDKVIKLELRKKRLKEFPPEIFRFKNLQYLDLSKNDIKEIPPGIDSLKSLQILIMSKNQLETLPKEIGSLKMLQYLNVNQNDIASLPPQIGSLINLKNFDLWSNDVDKFPAEMRNLKKLEVLDLRVILIPDAEQMRIQEMLPKTKIYFSPYCRCQQ